MEIRERSLFTRQQLQSYRAWSWSGSNVSIVRTIFQSFNNALTRPSDLIRSIVFVEGTKRDSLISLYCMYLWS